MKKFVILFASTLMMVGSLLLSSVALAADPVVDKEFAPGFNAYGRDNSVFISSCTRFIPSNASYASYFDLAVKNDQGAGYPMKASIRTAASSIAPSEGVLKSYTQSTFNNYAMSGNLFSRFTANDGQSLALTVGNYYFVCVDDLANNNATGWFYTLSVSGGYSRMGYPGDVQNTFEGSFGYRTYFIPAAQDGTTPENTPTTNGTTTTPTTGDSKVSQGSGPSSNISSAIKPPSTLAATHVPSTKSINLTWAASSTATIGGYNIYRSEIQGNGYTKIGDTGKTTVSFSDTAISTGKTYYYMVRTYKDNAESANSNETSAQVKAAGSDGSVTTTSETSVENVPWYKNPIIWGLIVVGILATLLLILIVVRRRKSMENAKSLEPKL